MKIYTETIKIASCDECPKAHNWDERCKVWGKMMNTTFNEPIPEDCPLPEEDAEWTKNIAQY